MPCSQLTLRHFTKDSLGFWSSVSNSSTAAINGRSNSIPASTSCGVCNAHGGHDWMVRSQSLSASQRVNRNQRWDLLLPEIPTTTYIECSAQQGGKLPEIIDHGD